MIVRYELYARTPRPIPGFSEVMIRAVYVHSVASAINLALVQSCV